MKHYTGKVTVTLTGKTGGTVLNAAGGLSPFPTLRSVIRFKPKSTLNGQIKLHDRLFLLDLPATRAIFTKPIVSNDRQTPVLM